MSSMADVLAGHGIYGFNGSEISCECRVRGPWFTQREYSAHQAAALSAAGFGVVADAKRDAWDEASRAIKSTIGAYTEEGVWAFEQAEKLNPNPYRAAVAAANGAWE